MNWNLCQILAEELKILENFDNFSRRHQNWLILLKVGSKELNHAATGDLKNGGRSVKRGSWPPDIPVSLFKVSAPTQEC